MTQCSWLASRGPPAVLTPVGALQLIQAQTGKFNVHVHVEYEWRLQNDDMDESEDEMEDKVSRRPTEHLVETKTGEMSCCSSVTAADPLPARGASCQLLPARQRRRAAQPGVFSPRRRLPGEGQTEASGAKHDDQQRDLRHRAGPQLAPEGADAGAAAPRAPERSDAD